MEKFLELRQRAEKNLKIAEHMLLVTFPLVKDSKLLLGVVDNIFLGLTNAMSSVVFYERTFKRIPPFHDNFESKYNAFALRIMPRYGIDKGHLRLLQRMKDLVLKHKKSPVEFARKKEFVICDEDYKIETLTIADLRKYLEKAKEFHTKMAQITAKHESIFKRRTVHPTERKWY